MPMLPIVFATALSDRFHSIPPAVWIRIGAGVLGLVLLVVIIGKVAKMNKVILAVVTLLVLSFVSFNWIYERNEPKWATPVVEKVATFFPSKDDLK